MRPTDLPVQAPLRRRRRSHDLHRGLVCLAVIASAGLAGCALPPPGPVMPGVQLPLRQGWFEGEAVFYVTTDVSDAEVAAQQGANFAPRLANALPRGTSLPHQPSSVDRVYAVTNFEQANVFASAPLPMGPTNRERAYSPLWRMVAVTWAAGHPPRRLTSEEQILAAADHGAVQLEVTGVVLNCPIVHRGTRGGLEGVVLPPPAPGTRTPAEPSSDANRP
jgi:hypothetical protein